MASRFIFQTSHITVPILGLFGVYSLAEMAWTNRRLEFQEKLHKEGLSNSEIDQICEQFPYGKKMFAEDNPRIPSK